MSHDDHLTDENKPNLPSHYAYNVEKGADDKNHWQKIGAAWPAKDGGLSLQLKTIPLDGKIALRSREALERMREERGQTQEQDQTLDMNPSQ
ncbi:MAG: hypothetical protein NMNS01_12010 [Nitrosomonas sp.]|nr:MAG: hypothetical protein NMNS01_12010 [Nitrosomonas sp.]